MTFGTLPLPLTLPFSFSDYLLSVPLSGQFFLLLSFEPAWGGRGEALIPNDARAGQSLKAGLTLSLVTFPIFFSFPPTRPRDPGRVMQRKKTRAVGNGRVRPLLPGVSLRASLLLSVLENQQPQISMLMQY